MDLVTPIIGSFFLQPSITVIWRTAAVGGPPFTDWTQANTDGFGEGSSHTAYIMIVYNGFLYTSASNGGPATPGV